MERSRVAIVIPALNESATILSVVRSASTYGVPIVVDDGSTDGTAKLAKDAHAVVVSHERNLGYDATLNTGFEAAAKQGCDVVITLDADGQHDSSVIEKLLHAIEAGADVVVGTRSRKQRLAEHVFGFYTRHRFGIRDPLCGLKAYRVEVYRALGHFDSYQSIGTELMIFAVKNGFRIDQVPFVVREREGRSRFGQVLQGNMKILRAFARCIQGDK